MADDLEDKLFLIIPVHGPTAVCLRIQHLFCIGQLLLDAGLLLLLALVVLTYSTKNALMLFVLAFLISPMGLPMVAVGLLSMLSTVRNMLAFS